MKRVYGFVVFLLIAGFLPAADSLLVEYKFDGSLRDTGSDGGSADTLTQGNPAYRQGISEQALLCDSTGFLAADSVDLDLAGSYTIELFVKPYAFSGQQCILSKGSYEIGISDGNLVVRHLLTNGVAVGGTFVRLEAGRWQHIAVVADSTKIFVYWNGQAVGAFFYDGSLLNSASPLSVGGGGSPFHGLIDEIHMFDVARSASYIASRAVHNCPSLPAGDADGDCRVTLDDVLLMAQQWLWCDVQSRTDCPEGIE